MSQPMRCAAAAVAFLASVVALPAAAPSVAAAPNLLYVHAADPANMDAIPMNVLAPPANFTFRHGGGPTAATLTCLPGGSQSHTVYAIQYAGPTDDTQPQQAIRVEWRGLAYATRATGNLSLEWWIEAAPSGTPVAPSTPLANVVIRATLREGEGVEGPGAFERGTLVAQGQTSPALLAGPQTQGARHAVVNGRDVYGFAVPLSVQSAALPATGFNLRVDVFVDNPACATSGGAVAPPLVVLHSSPDHRPVLRMGVAEPLRVLATNASESRAAVVHVRADVLPVWGGYAGANATVEATGPSQPRNTTTVVVLPRPTDPQTRPTTPAYVFWNWPAGKQRAAAGTYTFTLTASDMAGNAAAAAPLTFTIAASESHPPPSPTQGAPAWPVPFALSVLALGALLRRR